MAQAMSHGLGNGAHAAGTLIGKPMIAQSVQVQLGKNQR